MASGDTGGREPARPSSSLGRTSGVAAAGAWAARWEIASLLEARCDLTGLIEDIKGGREGEHILNVGVPSSFVGSLKSWSLARSPERSRPGKSTTERADSVKEKLLGSDSEWDDDLAKQQAILESLAGPKRSSLPPWISGSGSSGAKTTGPTIVGPSYLGVSSGSQDFRKSAMPPPTGSRVRGLAEPKRTAGDAGVDGETRPSDLGEFAKKGKESNPTPSEDAFEGERSFERP